jgi:hypothetical protein
MAWAPAQGFEDQEIQRAAGETDVEVGHDLDNGALPIGTQGVGNY